MTSETTLIVHAEPEPLELSQLRVVPPREGPELVQLRLSTAQHAALELFAKGETTAAVARAVNVDRGTIWRWRKTDPNFIAALNRWRGEAQAETRDRILAISQSAADAVDESIRDGNANLGLKVLEKLGCLKPGPDKPVDPYAIFGIGMDDESKRRPVLEGLARLIPAMTIDQRERMPQILAIGLAAENQLVGRKTPEFVAEMAGTLPTCPHNSAIPTPIDPAPASEARPSSPGPSSGAVGRGAKGFGSTASSAARRVVSSRVVATEKAAAPAEPISEARRGKCRR